MVRSLLHQLAHQSVAHANPIKGIRVPLRIFPTQTKNLAHLSFSSPPLPHEPSNGDGAAPPQPPAAAGAEQVRRGGGVPPRGPEAGWRLPHGADHGLGGGGGEAGGGGGHGGAGAAGAAGAPPARAVDGGRGPHPHQLHRRARRGPLERARARRRAEADGEELPAAVAQLPPARREARRLHRRRAAAHPRPPLQMGQPVVQDRVAAAGEDGQRDQELLADAGAEARQAAQLRRQQPPLQGRHAIPLDAPTRRARIRRCRRHRHRHQPPRPHHGTTGGQLPRRRLPLLPRRHRRQLLCLHHHQQLPRLLLRHQASAAPRCHRRRRRRLGRGGGPRVLVHRVRSAAAHRRRPPPFLLLLRRLPGRPDHRLGAGVL